MSELIDRAAVLDLIVKTSPIHRGPSTDLQRMIRAIPAQAMTWQPIETAPTDGTPVMLWALLDWRDVPVPVTGWYAKGSKGWVCHTAWLNPTHWMPLPSSPEQNTNEA